MTVELQITDQELIKKIGKTGRTAQQLEKIERAAGYDPSTSRMVLGKTDGIPPSYQITKIQLEALPDGTVLPAGKYVAVLNMKFYDMNSNELAVLNTHVPVTLEIKG